MRLGTRLIALLMGNSGLKNKTGIKKGVIAKL